MSPLLMTIALVAGWGIFFFSAWRRFRLLLVGAPAMRWDRLLERLKRTLIFAFGQARLPRYPTAGWAHMFIFWGFMVLLLRSMMLWGRGFDEDFTMWVLGDTMLGHFYSVTKDAFALIVWASATVFFAYRLIYRKTAASRMSHHWEAYLILGIIWVMMVADAVYDGANLEHGIRAGVEPGPIAFRWFEPFGSLLAMALAGAGDGTIAMLRHGGFWTHSLLVLVFLNILPYSKHFHVITSIPNVFFQKLDPPGHLEPIKDIEEAETFGISDAKQFSWKSYLDFYSCTECGRCSDNCPAWSTGKLLSPKQFTLDIRDNLYARAESLTGYAEPGVQGDTTKQGSIPDSEKKKDAKEPEPPKTNLVPDVISEEVIWACTTCRACEDVCPLFITYVEKIVDVRRNLVLEKGEIPGELANALRGVENNQNPWNLAAMDRSAWAEGLDIPRMADGPEVDVLFWVGCAASYDDRAKKIAVSMVKLMKAAGVKFAILGDEEQCCGDIVRRTGNEALWHEMAKANVEILNGYKVKRIVTICPHGFNTLLNEYPDYGGHYVVMSHGEYLADLLKQGKLKPEKEVAKRVVYHDSCYLGRYNEVYDSPRQVLASVPGTHLLEIERSRRKGLCCGAGGGQHFKEEEHARKGAESVRVNQRRVDQLLEAKPDCMATACPFCMTMISDGLKARNREEEISQLDIAEILVRSCGL